METIAQNLVKKDKIKFTSQRVVEKVFLDKL